MQTQLIIASILSLLEWLAPRLQQAVRDGEVTAEEQQNLKNRIDSFRSGEAFSGPEWQPSTSESPSPSESPSQS